MPGEVQHSLDSLVVEAKRLVSLGVPGLILFGVPASARTPQGSGAWDPEGVVQVALRAVRDAVGDQLVLMADLCLDEYTDHGHCGIARARPARCSTTRPSSSTNASRWPRPRPERTWWRPSGMMDGQVAAIRAALDGGGHDPVAILAYAVQVRVRALRAVPRRGRRHDCRGR